MNGWLQLAVSLLAVWAFYVVVDAIAARAARAVVREQLKSLSDPQITGRSRNVAVDNTGIV